MTEGDFIFVLGGPGSQRAVLCEKVSAEFEGWSYVSLGGLLRKEAETGSQRGQQCQKSFDEGELVPDEVVTEILQAGIQSSGGSKFIIDGYPRTANQAEAFKNTIGKFQLVIVIETPDDVMAARLAERGASSDRREDKPEIIDKRISVYKGTVMPFVDALKEQGKVQVISDDGEALELVKTAVQGIVTTLPAATESTDTPAEPAQETHDTKAEAEVTPTEANSEQAAEIQEKTPNAEQPNSDASQDPLSEVSELAQEAPPAIEAPQEDSTEGEGVGAQENPEAAAEVPPEDTMGEDGAGREAPESPQENMEGTTPGTQESPAVAETAPAATDEGAQGAGAGKPSDELPPANEQVAEDGSNREQAPKGATSAEQEGGEVIEAANATGDVKVMEKAEAITEPAADGGTEENGGEAAAAGESDRQKAAATTIQAVQRGRQARKQVAAMRKPAEASEAGNASSGDAVEPIPTAEADASDPAPVMEPPTEASPPVEGGNNGENQQEGSASAPTADAVGGVDEGAVEPDSTLEAEAMGDVAGSEEAAVAATKIQSVQRGRLARKEVRALKVAKREEQEKSAATKIQSVQRGRKARQEVEVLKASKRVESQKKQDLAATKIQSVQRGRKVRKEVNQLKTTKRLEEQTKRQGMAATKIQSVQRGRKARKEVEQLRQTRDETKRLAAEREKAAVQIQSVQRGRVARKEVAELRTKRRAALEKEKILSLPASASSPEPKEKSRKGGEKRINVREYMDSTVTPILRDGLKALNASRPSDPIQFLCDYLLDSKKSLPQGGK